MAVLQCREESVHTTKTSSGSATSCATGKTDPANASIWRGFTYCGVVDELRRRIDDYSVPSGPTAGDDSSTLDAPPLDTNSQADANSNWQAEGQVGISGSRSGRPTKAAPPGIITATAEAVNMATRRAWRYTGKKAGKISNLQLQSDTTQTLCRGDIRIAVKAVGLNFADVFTCLGLYNAFPGVGIPGLEFSGVVAEISDASAMPSDDQQASVLESAEKAIPDLKVGDRVMGVTRFGAFADQVVLPAHQVRLLPEGWDFAQGAAFLVQGLTAMYGLRSLGDLRKGHRALIHSAAGGVGLFAVAICEAVGAVPIATVGSGAKVEFLLHRFKSLTPDTIIVRDASRFQQQLDYALAATGGSAFDVVLDAVCGRFFEPAYSLLQRGGRYVVFGASDLTPQGDGVGWLKLAWQWLRRPRVDPMTMIGENRAVFGFNLIWMFHRVEVLMELADQLTDLDLPPPHVGERFSFEEAPEAIRKLQSGTTKGKVVLLVD